MIGCVFTFKPSVFKKHMWSPYGELTVFVEAMFNVQAVFCLFLIHRSHMCLKSIKTRFYPTSYSKIHVKTQ